jgi:glutathione S-transferase
MKLFLNTTSPYARLIRVLLMETGLESETELVFVDPWNATDDLIAANPAGKIPALALEDGTHLVESSCIADYLVHRSAGALSPHAQADTPARLEILGLGRAALDCSFGAVIQQRFAPDSALAERWLGALPRIARRLDGLCAKPSAADCDLGDLTVAVAFGYIDFRLPLVEWRRVAHRLADRIEALNRRHSLRATQPK